ncbi:MAG: leucine-rich repeat domain-containing protein, partial [Oscillospiraceae bacterium]|nr:leucine-rich repeat domain-containing protein [Oscillospiraceae bacterium]
MRVFKISFGLLKEIFVLKNFLEGWETMKLRKVLSLFVALVMMFEVLPLSSLATEIADATENVEVSAEAVEEETEEAETEVTVEETDVSDESDVASGNTAEGVLMISSSATRTASLAVASVSAVSSSEEDESVSDETEADSEDVADDVTVDDETIFDEETVEDTTNEYLIATVSDDSTVVDSGTCGADGDNLTWVLTSDGTLTISGEGEMENFYSDYYVPWYSYNESIFNVVISYGVTSVGSNAFSGCSSITDVSLANSVTTLGDFVFSGCTSLSEITIPSSIVTCKTYGPFSGLNIERVTFESDVIPKGILRNCKTLKYVVFSNGVTEIEQAAFRDCISLETIDLPEGLTTIGSYAFAGCTALYDVTLPESVTTIGSYAFLDCTSLLDINFPSSIESCGTSGPFSGSGIETVVCNATTIPSYTFRDCSELRYVIFSADTTEIGIYAFWNCTSLSDITLPESIETLGYNIFYGCTSLTEINIPSSFVSAGHHNDYGPFYGSSIESVTYEATVIPAYTFKGCSTLTNVNFVVSTIEIGNYAFENCTSLQSITLPQELTSLGVMAFYNCSSLESIELSAGLTSIGGVAFGECTSLQSVVLPDSLTSIEVRAFSGCTSLVDITLPDKLVSIGAYAFENCTSLSNIVLPDSLTTMNSYVFSNCTSLKTINIPINLSEASYAFTESCIEEVYCDAAVVSVRVFSDCTTLSKVTFTENTTEIKAYAFSGCTSLKEVSLPSSLTDLRNYVFADCTSLECVEISEGLLSIGDYVFSGCSSLYDISLPDTVTTLGILIFSGCSSLKEINLPLNLESVTYMAKGGTFSDSYIEKIVCNSTTIPENTCRDCTSLKTVEFVGNTVEISYNAFRDCTSLCEITLPDTLTTIASRAFSGCTELKSINLPENLSDAKYAFTDSCIEIVYCQLSVIPEFVFYDCSTLVTVELSESTTEIGSDAFSECTSLCNISFPEGIISIGVFSFGNCISLSNVTLPDSLTTIGAEAFEGCTSLTSINIPANVTSAYKAFCDSSLKNVSFDATTIPSYTFYGCDALTTIVFNSDLLEVGDYAFCGCTALSDFTLPSSVTTLGSYIFKDCTSLTSVNLPRDLNVVEYSLSLTAYCPFTGSSIETIVCEADVIPAYTFYGFTTLKTVTFTGNTTEICGHAFQGCTALSDITLPDSLTTIGEGAFYGCTSLTSINLPINIATVEYSTHGYCPFANSNIETVVCEANVVPTSTFRNYTTLKTVIFTGNTAEIGDYAFYGCTALSDIVLPDSLTTIGTRAFNGCDSLKEINLPINLTTVSYYISGLTYYGPFTESGLETVICEGSIVPSYSLYKCTSLTSVIFKGNTTEIGSYAFCGCTSLTEIDLPNSLTTLGNGVFDSCKGITEIVIPESLTTCNSGGAFSGSSITTATISDGMTTIPEYLFRHCTTLTDLIIPTSVTEVGEYATYYCSGLTDIYYAGTELQWNEITINSYNNLTAGRTRTIHYLNGYDYDLKYYTTTASLFTEEETISVGSTDVLAAYWGIVFEEDSEELTITIESSDPSVIEITSDTETSYTHTAGTWEWKVGLIYVNALSVGTADIILTTSEGYTTSVTIEVVEEVDTYTGFKAEIDGWSEINSSWSFGYEDGYVIPWNAYFQSSNYDVWDSFVSAIYKRTNTWKGNCFGLSILAIANYNGQIDLKDYFSSNSSYLNSYGYESIIYQSISSSGGSYDGNVYTLDGNTEIIRIIEKAQVSQFSSIFYDSDTQSKVGTIGSGDSDFSEVIEFLNENPETPLLVDMLINGSRHAVVLTSQKEEGVVSRLGLDESKWICYVLYDCNVPQLSEQLDDANEWYETSTSYLLLCPEQEQYGYAYFYSKDHDGSSAFISYGLNEGDNIEFYDIREVDSSYFESILGETLLDLIYGCYITVSGAFSVLDESGSTIFEMTNGVYTAYLDDVVYMGYVESSEYDGVSKGLLILPSEQYQVVCEGETSICSYLDDESAIAYYVSGDATITVDEEGLSISVVNNSDSYIEIEVALISSEGDTIADATGTLEAGTELDIQLAEDESGETVAVASTTSTLENITTELVVNGETADEDYHYTTMANNDAELISEAKTTLSSTDWTLTQSDVESATGSTTADKISTLIDAILAGLGIDSNVTVTYTITDITEAIAGDATDVDGTDGSFTINFTISAGNESDTLTETGAITATAYVHTHSLTRVEAVDATCTAEGNTEYWYCFGCDKYYSDENAENEITLADTVTAKIAHNYEAVITEPTCTEGGYTTYTCSNCGDSYVADETEATGHSYEAVVTEPTCTEAGVKTYTCTRCGDTYTEEIPATGHNYVATETTATCTEGGYTTYTCSNCGDSYVAD